MPWSGHRFERQRRILITASTMANARIQREGEDGHMRCAAQRPLDLSADLTSVGDGDGGLGDFPLPHGCGDQVKHGAARINATVPNPRCRNGISVLVIFILII
ncbi:hypothetical protein QFZ34_000354 [Phyllobacterium ifriqiyense]|uniref:Uncharacterized protein n=1 Tax=Phyllobacterium ifriqiyense TaxID=314238 RepID=A0ABU0S340_9HYPH|nr:hypothetical protein [Phyllobacterium ifriqiyense]MDQ0995177.1 hypothetical protein [Phyllobacterium ifriqiyense]